MHRSPSHLSEAARTRVVAALNAVLIDGLDLHSHLKVAHWNVKGPHFTSFHALFETIATELLASTDAIAERAVTLGGLAGGTTRQVAASTRLAELPQGTVKDMELIRLIADRVETFLTGARGALTVADEQKDADTVDLLNETVATFEKHGWFLRATLGE